MILLDSNIIIYATQPEHSFLLEMMRDRYVFVSTITKVEVLGYHKLTTTERSSLENFFRNTFQLPVTAPIIDRAIHIRQKRKIGLADSLIAATALVHSVLLVTRNTVDFIWIPDLQVLNPFQDQIPNDEASA